MKEKETKDLPNALKYRIIEDFLFEKIMRYFENILSLTKAFFICSPAVYIAIFNIYDNNKGRVFIILIYSLINIIIFIISRLIINIRFYFINLYYSLKGADIVDILEDSLIKSDLKELLNEYSKVNDIIKDKETEEDVKDE